MIVAVSDVHLGRKAAKADDFIKFLDNYDWSDVEHLVMCGDILDLWVRQNAQLILENSRIFSKLRNLPCEVYYVVGNHDYIVRNSPVEHFPLNLVKKYLRLESGKRKFVFMHGYELEVLAELEPMTVDMYEQISDMMCYAEDRLGRLMTWLWMAYRRVLKIRKPARKRKLRWAEQLANSELRSFFLPIAEDEYLIWGHTHHALVEERMANAGSWCDEDTDYLTIDGGKVEHHTWR